MTKKSVIITFEESAKDIMLSFLDKSVDNDGFIVEKNDVTKRILASDGNEIKLEEFSGTKDGVFFRNDISSLFDLSDVM